MRMIAPGQLERVALHGAIHALALSRRRCAHMNPQPLRRLRVRACSLCVTPSRLRGAQADLHGAEDIQTVSRRAHSVRRGGRDQVARTGGSARVLAELRDWLWSQTTLKTLSIGKAAGS